MPQVASWDHSQLPAIEDVASHGQTEMIPPESGQVGPVRQRIGLARRELAIWPRVPGARFWHSGTREVSGTWHSVALDSVWHLALWHSRHEWHLALWHSNAGRQVDSAEFSSALSVAFLITAVSGEKVRDSFEVVCVCLSAQCNPFKNIRSKGYRKSLVAHVRIAQSKNCPLGRNRMQSPPTCYSLILD